MMIKRKIPSRALLVSASVFSMLCVSSVQALNQYEEVGIRHTLSRQFAKLTKTATEGAQYAGEIVVERGKGFVRGKAFDALDLASDKIGKAAANKLHALVYRDSSVHVVDDAGDHIGYVETVAPRLVRNILKNQLGFDLDGSVPGVPTVVMKAIGNYLENRVAEMLEGQVFDLAKKATQKAAIAAVGKAMGLAQDQIDVILQKKNSSGAAQVEAAVSIDETIAAQQIKSDLSKQVQADEQEAYGNIAAGLIRNFSARLKINLNDYIKTAAQDVATFYAHQLIDDTGELTLRYGESVAGVGVVAAASVLSGGSGAALAATAVTADQRLAEGGHQDSFIRQGLKWLFGYDARKEEAKAKASLVVPMALNIDSILQQLGLGNFLVPTQKDFDAAYGKHEAFCILDEEGDEWTEIRQTVKPVNFTELFQEARDTLAAARAKVVEVVEQAATVVQETAKAGLQEAKHVVAAFNEAAVDFSEALNPMMRSDFWDDESEVLATVSSSAEKSQKPWWKVW
ncbi:MAG: hypothetical protein K2W92_08730 [Alphaproteobacteria bacterium]|nr:hypothetical protein [Alphaproteobacteria bacterium]